MSTRIKGGCRLLHGQRADPTPASIKLVNIVQRIEAALRNGHAQDESNVTHTFTHDAEGKINCYRRGFLMQAGDVVVSKKHRLENFYFILTGSGWVWTEEAGWKPFRAPASGMTNPGTVRVLLIDTNSVWATCHPTDTSDLVAIEESVIAPTPIPDALIQRALADIQLLLQ